MKHTITLVIALVAMLTRLVAANSADPIQQALNSLRENKDLPPETQKALVAATEALRLPSPVVKSDRDREIICNRIEANATRYKARGDNMTETEKEDLVARVQAAHAAGVVALKGQPVAGDRQEHIQQLLRIVGHVHLDVAKGVKYAALTEGYYLLAIRAIAGAPGSAAATPSANPPSAPAPQASSASAAGGTQMDVPQPPVASANTTLPAPTTPAPPQAPVAPAPPAKKPITRTPPQAAPHVAQ